MPLYDKYSRNVLEIQELLVLWASAYSNIMMEKIMKKEMNEQITFQGVVISLLKSMVWGYF